MKKGVPTLWSVGPSCLLDLACALLLLCHHAAAAPTTSLPPFVFVPVVMSTTFATSLVVVIIGHSTDFSIIVQYVLSKFIAAYDYCLFSVILT